jgi:hypothetical protein
MLISQTRTKSQKVEIDFLCKIQHTYFIDNSNAEAREELVKLAQFAKHHVPETHPKDTEDFVENRIKTLVKGGAVSACVSVAETESKKALELLANCMSAFCSVDELRG